MNDNIVNKNRGVPKPLEEEKPLKTLQFYRKISLTNLIKVSKICRKVTSSNFFQNNEFIFS
jgi:hypothetical protein